MGLAGDGEARFLMLATRVSLLHKERAHGVMMHFALNLPFFPLLFFFGGSSSVRELMEGAHTIRRNGGDGGVSLESLARVCVVRRQMEAFAFVGCGSRTPFLLRGLERMK